MQAHARCLVVKPRVADGVARQFLTMSSQRAPVRRTRVSKNSEKGYECRCGAWPFACHLQPEPSQTGESHAATDRSPAERQASHAPARAARTATTRPEEQR